MTVNDTPRSGAGIKIIAGILIAANLLMLAAGIITIPPNIRAKTNEDAAHSSSISSRSESQSPGTSLPDSSQTSDATQGTDPLIEADAPPATGLVMQDVLGTYEYLDSDSGNTGSVEVKNSGGSLTLHFPSGEVVYFTYDQVSGTANHSETVDGKTWEYLLTFTPDGDGMNITIVSKRTTDGTGRESVFEGQRVTVGEPPTPGASGDATIGHREG